jgi:plastocyanin
MDTAQRRKLRRGSDQRLMANYRDIVMSRNMMMIIGAVLLAATVGCASVATTSRTGTIHEVSFAERMMPANLSVRAGDEIRWVNKRSQPVTVEFLEGALANVSCEEGFSQRALSNVRARRQESTTIQPNASASLCFTQIGTVAYNARMESALAGGQTIESGSIRVGQ